MNERYETDTISARCDWRVDADCGLHIKAYNFPNWERRQAGRKKVGADFHEAVDHLQPIHQTHTKMPSTYKKDKPWDTDDIDKWKVCQSQRHSQIFILQR